ncbi:MAG: hypothetical protein ACUVQG_10830 [Thermogutta sp.]
MPDRLPRQRMPHEVVAEVTPQERLKHVAAILARGVARYLQNSRTDAVHPAVPLGPENRPNPRPRALSFRTPRGSLCLEPRVGPLGCQSLHRAVVLERVGDGLSCPTWRRNLLRFAR